MNENAFEWFPVPDTLPFAIGRVAFNLYVYALPFEELIKMNGELVFTAEPFDE